MEIIRLGDSGGYDERTADYDFSNRGERSSCDLANSDYDSGIKKITDIRAAARDENRVNVFVNGKYDFSLDIAQLVDLKVKVGLEISAEQLEEFRWASEFGKLYQRTLEWVLMRPRSVREVKDYLQARRQKRRMENLKRERNRERMKELKKAGEMESLARMREMKIPLKELPEIEAETCELVFDRLLERGYVDDVKFAEYYVENRFVKKGVSRRRLEMELLKKGVSKDVAAEVLAGSSRNEEEEILKVIKKKRGKYTDEKLISYLCRQGFSFELVQNLVRSCEMD